MKTKFEAVQAYIIKKIEAGTFADGERLPSCRQLSIELGINKITINKAYSALEEKHYVYSVPRGGFYVINRSDEVRVTSELIDFTLVKPEEKLIPFRAFTHAMNNAIELHKVKLFNENNPQGLLSLRETLSKRFALDGIYASPENMVITHGSQQGLDLAFQLLCKGKKLLIESPSYSLAINRAKSLGLEIESIDRTKDGISIQALENIFRSGDVACFYIVPRYHNPTAYSLSETQKKEIAALCNQYDVWIIEDDYLGDLGKAGEGLPIHYYDTNQRVVYLRSFSKTFMPGIRIGALLCPDDLIERFINLKKNIDLGTSVLTQSALDIFIQSGMYDQHIKKIRKSYQRKLSSARRLLESYKDKDFTYFVPETGIFIWLESEAFGNGVIKIEALKKEGLSIKTSESFYLDNCGHNQVRLCISSVDETDIYELSRILKML